MSWWNGFVAGGFMTGAFIWSGVLARSERVRNFTSLTEKKGGRSTKISGAGTNLTESANAARTQTDLDPHQPQPDAAKTTRAHPHELRAGMSRKEQEEYDRLHN
jgi:hypothetical protein